MEHLRDQQSRRDKWGNSPGWPEWPECGAGMCECHYYERLVVDGELEGPAAETESAPQDRDLTEVALGIFDEIGIEPQ